MNNKYFLLLILISFSLESHTLIKRFVYTVGTASAALAAHYQIASRATLKQTAPVCPPLNTTIIPSVIPPVIESQPTIPQENPTAHVSATSIVEATKHGILETAFNEIKAVHPKFLANYLELLRSSAHDIDQKLRHLETLESFFGFMTKKITQLDAAQAKLFEQMQNEHGKKIHDLIQEFKEAKQPFERLENFYHMVEARFRQQEAAS